MKPALGVTEPGAIAFAVSTAKAHIKGTVKRVGLRLNSGMYKNAFTCGIPGTSEVGNYYAAALGAVAADPKKGLECLEGIGKAEEDAAGEMIKAGMISVSMSSITSRIFIEATVTGEDSEAVVTIQDAHTNITKITENGTVVFEKEAKAAQESKEDTPLIHQYTLAQMVEYVNTVSAQELDFIKEAYKVNYELLQEGLKSPKTTYGPYLLKKNGGFLVSEDERKTASLFCNGAIEARVIGLSKPAMSITGSGAHGIIATMPLYAVYKINNYTDEQLLRATALSYLVCMYIKEYSGKLSAFYGFSTGALAAPQANAMAAVIDPLMNGVGAPWLLYGIGAVLALVLTYFKVPALAFALGMFIPLELNLPLLVGGAVNWYVTTRSKDEAVNAERGEKGTLLASGFIAGGALMGVVSAAMRFGGINLINEEWLSNPLSEVLSMAAYILLIIWLVKASMHIKKK